MYALILSFPFLMITYLNTILPVFYYLFYQQFIVPMFQILVKFEDYIRTSKQDCLSLIGPLLTAYCSEQQEAPLLDELLAKLSCALGRIDVS